MTALKNHDISAWPQLDEEATLDSEWVPNLRHLLTVEYGSDLGRGKQTGVAIWATQSPSLPRIGLQWDWMRINKVVCLLDPMMIMSNAGGKLSPPQRIVLLNTVVHELDWQVHVANLKIEAKYFAESKFMRNQSQFTCRNYDNNA